MARPCFEDAQRKVTQGCLEMDPGGEKKERQTEEHLAKDRDDGAEGDGPYLGRSTGQSTRPDPVEVYDCGLMSQPGRRG